MRGSDNAWTEHIRAVPDDKRARATCPMRLGYSSRSRRASRHAALLWLLAESERQEVLTSTGLPTGIAQYLQIRGKPSQDFGTTRVDHSFRTGTRSMGAIPLTMALPPPPFLTHYLPTTLFFAPKLEFAGDPYFSPTTVNVLTAGLAHGV